MDEEIKKNILKTGTSILGIVCKDGVVMAADTRVTAGNLIVSKNFKKVMKVNEYLVISWTGSVADAQKISKIVPAELRLKELRSKKRSSIKEAANLVANLAYNGIRQPTVVPFIAGTLVAGYNEDGSAELYSIEPAGSVMKVEDYDANFGSGMPFILGLLERQYNKNISVKEGVELAIEGIKASTQRDNASGNGIDVFTITKEGIHQVPEQEIVNEFRDRK